MNGEVLPDLAAIPRNKKGIEIRDSRNGMYCQPNAGHCWIVSVTKTEIEWDRWFSLVLDLMRAGF